MDSIFFHPYLNLTLLKQSSEDVQDAKNPLRSYSMKNYLYVPIFMMIGKTLAYYGPTNKQNIIHFYIFIDTNLVMAEIYKIQICLIF